MSGRDLYLRRVLDGALHAVVGVDADGTVLGWNAEAARMLGWSAGEAIGRRLDELALPAGQWAAFREAAGRRTELPLRDRDGAGVPVEASVTSADLGCGQVLIAFLRDLRPERRAERLRQAEHEVVRLLAGARTSDRPIGAVLRIVGAALGDVLCEWWEREDGVLERSAHWGDGDGRVELAGEAWELGRLTVREPAAMRAGGSRSGQLHSGAAVPVLVDRGVAGVLTVSLSASDRGPDGGAIGLLEGVAGALGQFEGRRRADQAGAEETLALATIARVVRRLSRSTDAATAREAICTAALEACDSAIAYLAEADDERGGLLVTAVAGAELREGPAAILPYDSSSPAVQAHRTASQVFVPDMAATLSTPARYTAQELGAVSGLVQPVGRPDSPCGVLGVAWDRRIGSLPPRIASVMELLADEAAIALGRAALMRDLETAALTDPLTGLPNLRAWDDALARELATASRDGRPVCVAVADLDGFKGFNDTHGHLAGDRLLRAAVAAWQQSLRAGDVLARLGGDEFAILLPTCRTDGAVALAERLRRSTPGDRTCSVGIAEWDGSERAHELVARADTALYEAKARGRDRVVAL